uniref:Uncharacterized protein n=1 Tax=Echeneis naucrates TaxID=173247 RepID=A0A665SWH7_ECHNA
VHPLNDVTTVIENAADVFCVDCTGEVGVTVMPSVPAGLSTPLTIIRCSVACKFWEILFNFRFPCQNLLSKQVLFVQEEDYRNDVLEKVKSFLQSVGLIVLSDHHVVAATRHHEDDSCHICITNTNAKKTSCMIEIHFNSLEIDFVNLKSCLKDPRCQYSASHVCKEVNKRDLLLRTVDELIFIGPFPAGPHTLILPEDLCMVIKLLQRHRGMNNLPHLQITASLASK